MEQFVKTQVSSGQFNNASEVHRAALAAMAHKREEREIYLDGLRCEINVGLNDLEANRSPEFASHEALDTHLDSTLSGLDAAAS